MAVTFDNSILSNYFQARNGLANTAAGTATTSSRKKYAPTAPWSATSNAVKTPELVKTALTGRKLIDEGAAKLDLEGASADYKKLFALYQGLSALEGIAAKAGGKNVPSYEMTKLKSTFERGLKEVADYADVSNFEQIRMTNGAVATSLKGTVGVPKNKYDYVTDVLHTGAATDEIPAFKGTAAFDIAVKKGGVTTTVAIDLAGMGATPRTMQNVVSFINGKLSTAGFTTRFGIERTPGQPKVLEGAGGKKITIPATGDQYALRVRGDSAEQLNFNAVSRPAVYVTTYAGDPNPDKDTKTDDGVFQNRLLKIDPSGATAPETRIKTETLEANILQVRQTKIGADGSVYMLADVEKAVSGQTIKGEKDVALLKYDSAGNIMYARALGAGEEASGMALALSSDGKIAISGAVKGEMAGTTNGPINSSAKSGTTDSFVTLYDAKGDEVWTVRRGTLDQDEASALTFGADGMVYVAGRAKGSMPSGTGAVGGYDSYVSAISTTEKGVPRVLFTQQFGTALDDKPAGIVVDASGRVTVAGNENNKAVLRSFDISRTETRTTKTVSGGQLSHTIETYVNGALTNSATTNYGATTAADSIKVSNYVSAATATAGATRNLGDLAGGAIAGLAIDGGELVIAGHTRNNALGLGTPSQAHAGAMDAFAGRLSLDLSDTSADELTYYGGAGDNTVAGFSVSGGKVWIAGSAGADLPSLVTDGKQGYVAALDTATGAVTGAQRINGKDGQATATSIAVSDTGASALDRFGLPKGALDYDLSQKIVGSTAARAGDTFQIRVREGAPPMTITLEANDTLTTLADKIRRKAGFSAKVDLATANNSRTLRIQPNNDNAVVEILPGKGGKDLLEALGLDEGIVRRTEFRDGKTRATANGGEVYGLALDLEINLSDKEQIHHAQAVLAAAMNKVRAAYKDLESLAKPETVKQAESGKTGGAVPAYLTAQLANYQAGLSRLTGGG